MPTAFMQRVRPAHGTLPARTTGTAQPELWSLDTCLQRLRDIVLWNVSPAARPAPRRRYELEGRVARAFHACQLGTAQLVLAHERRETARALSGNYARRRGDSATPAQGALLERAHRRADEHLREAGQQLARARAQLGSLLHFDFTQHTRLTALARPPQADTLSMLLARVAETPVESELRDRYARVHRLADLAVHYEEKVLDHYRNAFERAAQSESTALQLLRSHEKYFDAREVHLALLAQSWTEAADLRLALTLARLPADHGTEVRRLPAMDRQRPV